LSETGAGSLFEFGSIASLTQSLIRLIDSRHELDALRHVSVQAVRDLNSWASTAERLETIIASRLGVNVKDALASSTHAVPSLHTA
jgi:hypothetical protein